MKPKLFSAISKKSFSQATVAALILIVGIQGCSTQIGAQAVANYNERPLTVAIAAGLSPDAIKRAMMSTLINRRWTIQRHSENEVVGRLTHRGFDAIVTLRSDDYVITILNKATHTDLNTGETKPGVPMGWLENLQKDLRTNIQSALLSTQ